MLRDFRHAALALGLAALASGLAAPALAAQEREQDVRDAVRREREQAREEAQRVRERERDRARAARDREKEGAKARARDVEVDVDVEDEPRPSRTRSRGAAGARADARGDARADAVGDGDAGRPGRLPVTELDTVVRFDARGAVDLELLSGEIVVTGWDRDEVRVVARTERGRLRFAATSRRITLDVAGGPRGIGETRYELSVPRGARVLLKSVSGDVAVAGVRGELEARTTSGDVAVDDALGLTFATVSGDVDGRAIAGDVRGTTVSGDVRLAEITGDVDVETTSGEIAIPGARSRQVRLETVSGEIEFDGPVDAAGRYDFRSHSGVIRLALPADVAAMLTVETFSGELDSEFPLTLRPSDRDRGRTRRFEFVLGDGGAHVTAETFSGDVILQRAAGAAGAAGAARAPSPDAADGGDRGDRD